MESSQSLVTRIRVVTLKSLKLRVVWDSNMYTGLEVPAEHFLVGGAVSSIWLEPFGWKAGIYSRKRRGLNLRKSGTGRR